MLEMILRTTHHECARNASKSIVQLMLKLMQSEVENCLMKMVQNEENTIVALKICVDHLKNYRPPYFAEVSSSPAEKKFRFQR